jgi:hypothetical protein
MKILETRSNIADLQLELVSVENKLKKNFTMDLNSSRACLTVKIFTLKEQLRLKKYKD